MNGSLLSDAFAHHVWATLTLIDTCSTLPPDQLEAAVPGTYGSILDTLRHTVGADVWFVSLITGGAVPEIDEDAMDLAELRAAMAANGPAWATLLAGELDADAVVARPRQDGSEVRAPLTIWLAQALHHGTDHRSQVCTALTGLGVEPPDIDAWDFAHQDGRLWDTR